MARRCVSAELAAKTLLTCGNFTCCAAGTGPLSSLSARGRRIRGLHEIFGTMRESVYGLPMSGFCLSLGPRLVLFVGGTGAGGASQALPTRRSSASLIPQGPKREFRRWALGLALQWQMCVFSVVETHCDAAPGGGGLYVYEAPLLIQALGKQDPRRCPGNCFWFRGPVLAPPGGVSAKFLAWTRENRASGRPSAGRRRIFCASPTKGWPKPGPRAQAPPPGTKKQFPTHLWVGAERPHCG